MSDERVVDRDAGLGVEAKEPVAGTGAASGTSVLPPRSRSPVAGPPLPEKERGTPPLGGTPGLPVADDGSGGRLAHTVPGGGGASDRIPFARTLSLLALIGAWALASRVAADPNVLPSPMSVGALAWREAIEGDLWRHLTATLSRVAAAFAIAMAVGTGLGLWLGRSRIADRWLDPWVVVLLNLPALVVIVLAYIWMGLTEAAAITAVAINKIPTVTVMMREGARALDPMLDDLGRVFRLDAGTRLRHVVLPQLVPHLAAAARAGLSLIWKIVLVVEFLGRSSGVGFQIHLHFQLFDVGMVLVYALSFVVVMLVIETLALRPLEARASAWRRS